MAKKVVYTQDHLLRKKYHVIAAGKKGVTMSFFGPLD